MRKLSGACGAVLAFALSSCTFLHGQTSGARSNSNGTAEPVWNFAMVNSELTLFGKPLREVEGLIAKVPALDGRGKVIGGYQIVASCSTVGGAFLFRIFINSSGTGPDLQFKQFDLHTNDSGQRYGLGSIYRDPWTKSGISFDGRPPFLF